MIVHLLTIPNKALRCLPYIVVILRSLSDVTHCIFFVPLWDFFFSSLFFSQETKMSASK